MSAELIRPRLSRDGSATLRDLDTLAEVARQTLHCDLVFISVTETDSLFSVGLDLDTSKFKAARVEAVLKAICAETMRRDQTVLLADASIDPKLSHLDLATSGRVGGYLGVPLREANGQEFGAVCAICETPHEWEASDVQFLEKLSRLVSALILKELQRTELARLHESLQEADLVAMSLANEMSSLVSVQDLEGSVMFSSMALMKLASEASIAKAGFPLIQKYSSDLTQVDPGTRRDKLLPHVGKQRLGLRSGRTADFHVTITGTTERVFFLEWAQQSASAYH